MSTFVTLLGLNLAMTLGAFLVLWLASLAIRNVSIVDLYWGLGFVLVAWSTYLMLTAPDDRAKLLAALTTFWGTRLSSYLVWRNWGKGEDRRYGVMRVHHGQRFWLVSLGTVFALQAFLLWFISWPVQCGMIDHEPIWWLDFVGVAICLTGIAFESIGDWQLAQFKRDPANKDAVLDTGLWRYTRHPNYFGDFCVWWGLWIIAAAGGAWWTVLSPLVMSFLLFKFSGAALLESTITDRRPDYRNYIERTNAFFPGPPK